MSAPYRDHGSALRLQAREDAAIWTRLWVGIGFSDEIPAAGDILPYTTGNHGLHVERTVDGGLVGRFNKAQHGGCRSVPVQCQTGAKTRCSFTACGHSRDRRPILSTDADRLLHLDQYLGLRPERLLPVAVETYGPLLVACLDPRTATAARWPRADDVFGRDGPVDSAETQWCEFAVEWKALAVAFAGAGATTLFPNIAVWRGDVVTTVVVLQPVGLDRTLCRVRVFACADDVAAVSDAVQMLRDVAAAAAGVWARPAIGSTSRGDRAGFDAHWRRAIEGLADEVPTHTLFRTDEKDPGR